MLQEWWVELSEVHQVAEALKFSFILQIFVCAMPLAAAISPHGITKVLKMMNKHYLKNNCIYVNSLNLVSTLRISKLIQVQSSASEIPSVGQTAGFFKVHYLLDVDKYSWFFIWCETPNYQSINSNWTDDVKA